MEWDHDTDIEFPTSGYTPASYGFANNPNVEYLYLLKSDGKGNIIERRMNIRGLTGDTFQENIDLINTDNSLSYEVVTNHDGIIIVENTLNENIEIYWGINESEDLVIYKKNSNDLFISKSYKYEINSVTSVCNATRTIDFYSLGIELQISDIGAMKKISSSGETTFKSKYSL